MITDNVSDIELVERFHDVTITYDNKELYRGWLQRELLINRCNSCGTWHHPPKPLCPACWSFDITPTSVSGRGAVYFFMRLHQGPPAPDVDYSKPYPVVTVELVEQPGLRYSSTIVDCAPEELTVGLEVELDWIERYDAPYPVFRPAR